MEPLEIVPSEHIAHIKVKYADLGIEDLRSKRKELAGNKRTRANVGRTSFDLGMEIAEGLFKTMQSIYPKYVEAVGFVAREETRSRVTDGKIENYVVTMYKIAIDQSANFVGLDVTEMDAVKHLADVAKEDENLSPEDLIRKYEVSENLFFTKEALKSATIVQMTLEYRRAKVLQSLHTLTLQTIDQMISEIEMADQYAKVERMTKWISPEGRKKLFGF